MLVSASIHRNDKDLIMSQLCKALPSLAYKTQVSLVQFCFDVCSASCAEYLAMQPVTEGEIDGRGGSDGASLDEDRSGKVGHRVWWGYAVFVQEIIIHARTAQG